jgi:hypothetical protein
MNSLLLCGHYLKITVEKIKYYEDVLNTRTNIPSDAFRLWIVALQSSLVASTYPEIFSKTNMGEYCRG